MSNDFVDVIRKNLPELAEHYFDITLRRKAGSRRFAAADEARIVDAFNSLLPKVSLDFINQNVSTSAKILEQLAAGKLTLTEAKISMDLLDKQQVIDTVPELERKVAELSQSTKQVGR